MCVLEKLNFKISRGSMPPDLVYSLLQCSILFQPDQLRTASTGRVVMPKMVKSAKLKLIKKIIASLMFLRI